MRFIDILEARRNPHLNTRETIAQQLSRYAGRKDVFVTFTEDVGSRSHGNPDSANRTLAGYRARGRYHNARGSKLGINPRSTYNTPIGIYAYPVDYVIGTKGRVEFGPNRPFMVVFRVRNMDKVLELDKYSDYEFELDFEKLAKQIDKYDVDADGALEDANVDTPGGKLWNLTRVLAQNIADYHNDEEYLDSDEDEYDDEDEDREEKIVAQPFVQWNAIMRYLGYDGVVDRNGEGIIHDNEPTQAVFFMKSAIEEVAVIHNRYEGNEHKSEHAVWLDKPHIFVNLMKKGRLSDQKIIDTIKKSDEFFFRKIGFDAFPKHIQRYMIENYREFLRDDFYRHGIVSQFPLPSAAVIDLADEEPRFLMTQTTIAPEVVDHIVQNAKRFANVIPKLDLPVPLLMKLIRQSPAMANAIAQGSTELSDSMVQAIIKANPNDPNILLTVHDRLSRLTDETKMMIFKLALKHRNQLKTAYVTPYSYLNSWMRREVDMFLKAFSITPVAVAKEFIMRYFAHYNNRHDLIEPMIKARPNLEPLLKRLA